MPGRSRFEVIRPEVRGISAYTLEHVEAEVKLDQNENPYDFPEALKREIVERVQAHDWNRYPEFVPSRLIDALSRFTGWTRKGIVVGNGSNELIQAALTITLGPGLSGKWSFTWRLTVCRASYSKVWFNSLAATVEVLARATLPSWSVFTNPNR